MIRKVYAQQRMVYKSFLALKIFQSMIATFGYICSCANSSAVHCWLVHDSYVLQTDYLLPYFLLRSLATSLLPNFLIILYLRLDVHILTYVDAVQQDPDIVIAHPGQDIELMCTVTPSGSGSVAWIINGNGPYGVNSIQNGIASGYTANLGSNNLIVQNITMNDDRNVTEYQCVIAIEDEDTMFLQPIEMSNVTILYVAGE